LPEFENAYLKHQTAADFIVLARAGSPDPAQFVSSNGYTLPFGIDIDGMKTFSLTAIPATLVFDADGILVDKRIGLVSEAELEAMLAKAM
jgi:hypothetical protein